MNIDVIEVAPSKFTAHIIKINQVELQQYIKINHCPCCNQENSATAVEIGGTDWKDVITVRQCQDCGHIYYGSCPSESGILQYYKDEWMNEADQKKIDTQFIVQKKYKIANLLSELNIKDQNISLFDVGCGSAGLLEGLRDKGYHNLFGCEQSRRRYEYVTQIYGDRIYNSGFQDIHPTQKFDVIYSNHVIEHIHNPAKYIEWCAHNLSENGMVISCMPDAEHETAVGQTLFLPHLHSFTKESATALGKRFGFEVLFWKNCRKDEMCVIYTKSTSVLNNAKISKDNAFVLASEITFPDKKILFSRLKNIWCECKTPGQTKMMTYHIASYISCPKTKERSYARLSPLQACFLKLVRRLAWCGDKLKLKFITIRSHLLLKLISRTGNQIKCLGYIKYRCTDMKSTETPPRLSMNNQAFLIIK